MISKRYTIVRTSFGDLYITAEHGRIIRIGTERPHVSSAMRNDRSPLLRSSAQAILHYLNGHQTTFPASLPIRLLPFQRDVFAAVGHIPYGHTVTVDELARSIGKPHAVRAVEAVCRTNPYYIAVPCHRVILSKTNDRSPELLSLDEALRRLERRHLDKAQKRG